MSAEAQVARCALVEGRSPGEHVWATDHRRGGFKDRGRTDDRRFVDEDPSRVELAP